jgi:DNA-binding CsgD family transcriptional regulator
MRTTSSTRRAAIAREWFRAAARSARVTALLACRHVSARGRRRRERFRRVRAGTALEELARVELLTAAEVHAVALATSGASNAEIARARGTTARTVANLLARAYRKLGVASRRELVAKLAHGACAPDEQALAPRDLEILARLARGDANKVIAYELALAVSTVADRLARIRRKLGASSNLELARRFAPNRCAARCTVCTWLATRSTTSPTRRAAIPQNR